MRREPSGHAKAALLAIATLIGALMGAPVAEAGSANSSRPLPVPYTFAAGVLAELATPGASPPGANDFSCRPSPAHPRPVVLLHDFGANMTDSWQTVSPLLHNNGYCVFALTYGTYPRVDPTLQLGGLDYIQNSAAKVAAFVQRVLTATGADKVDLVGWSEGGLLARYYIQFDGGAKVVNADIGLASANGPTNISQLIFATAKLSPAAAAVVKLFVSGAESLIPLAGQAADPTLEAQLDVHGGTSDSVHYTNIASNYDELVPPSSAFVPTGLHVTNVVLQAGCPLDLTDHLAIVADPRAMWFMLNALDPTHPSPPTCTLVVPVIG